MVNNYNLKLSDFEFGFGHSLGELTAATIAGSFDLYDAIKLSKDR
jgi:malonyl CoA-acyl carrier protein transacylase